MPHNIAIHHTIMSAKPGTPMVKASGKIACDLPDGVQATIATLQSRTLREAVAQRCREIPSFSRFYIVFHSQLLDNIARGELLRLLPLEIQARIFSFICVEERVRVLETISGGQVGIWGRVQVNFRRAVLETYKSVRTIKDLGPKCSKLKLLQATGGQLEILQTRFPNLQVNLDASELQGYIYVSKDNRLRIIQLDGHIFDFHFCSNILGPPEWRNIQLVQVDSTSIMLIASSDRNGAQLMFNLSLTDMSTRECATPLRSTGYYDRSAIVHNDCLYVPSYVEIMAQRTMCDRYNITSNSWEHIADMHYSPCTFVTWDNSLYALHRYGTRGAVERCDSDNDKWTVVHTQTNLEQTSTTYCSAIVVDNTLYCCVDVDKDNTWSYMWKIDMLTGQSAQLYVKGLPKVEYSRLGPFHSEFYEKEGHICLMKTEVCLTKTEVDVMPFEIVTELKWQTFVLDQSLLMWRSVESGCIDTIPYNFDLFESGVTEHYGDWNDRNMMHNRMVRVPQVQLAREDRNMTAYVWPLLL